MKIAVWHNLPSGGGKRALYYHVRGLVERGHHVEVWCPPTADQTYLPLSELITEHIVPFSWQPRAGKNKLDGLTVIYRSFASRIKAMHQHCQQCAEEINRGDFDLLFANTCQMFFSSPIGRYVKLPKVLYLQEPCRWLYEAIYSEAAPQLPWIARPPEGGYRWTPKSLEHFLIDMATAQTLRVQAREELTNAQAFDALLVNSYFSRESVLRAYGLNARICYLGIDTKLFKNRNRPREDFILGVGAFVSAKNIRLVIKALDRVKEPRPRLVWVGNSTNSSSHIEELKRFAESVNVNFVPMLRVNDNELVDILNRATMMVYAPRLEPFGFAPLEASACGLPVVGIAEGGVRETIVHGQNGLIVEPDERAMAAAIEHLLNDKSYARTLGENGSRLVPERWSLKASVDRLEFRFTETIDAHGFTPGPEGLTKVPEHRYSAKRNGYRPELPPWTIFGTAPSECAERDMS